MGKTSGRRGGGKSPGSGYESVRRWTKNVDIFAKDFIFVPINEHLHWSLMVIYRPGAYLSEQRAKLSLPDEAAADDAVGGRVDRGAVRRLPIRPAAFASACE